MIEGIELAQLPSAIEALLFVSDEPVSAIVLAKMLEENVEEVELALDELQRRLDEDGRGIQLREVAGGWRLYTNPAYHELVQKYVLSWDTRKLSGAALETLAVVAYSQPVTRAQVSSVRGVTSDSTLATLIDRGYVREVGPADAPGNPMLYATTQTFLEKYGLRSPADLPNLEEFAPDENTARLIRERLGAHGAPAAQGEPGMPAAQGGAGFAPGLRLSGVSGEGHAHALEGVPAGGEELGAMPDERDLAPVEEMAAGALAGALGVVDKIDFDSLVFNTDDE